MVAALWANGLAERVNKFLKSLLRKVIEEQRDWNESLDIMQYVINNTVYSAIKTTSFKLLLEYDQRHSDLHMTDCFKKIAKLKLDCNTERDNYCKVALEDNKKTKGL